MVRTALTGACRAGEGPQLVRDLSRVLGMQSVDVWPKLGGFLLKAERVESISKQQIEEYPDSLSFLMRYLAVWVSAIGSTPVEVGLHSAQECIESMQF